MLRLLWIWRLLLRWLLLLLHWLHRHHVTRPRNRRAKAALMLRGLRHLQLHAPVRGHLCNRAPKHWRHRSLHIASLPLRQKLLLLLHRNKNGLSRWQHHHAGADDHRWQLPMHCRHLALAWRWMRWDGLRPARAERLNWLGRYRGPSRTP